MPRTQANEEVQILRFFEEAPLERAELLFNIVKEKMRTRGADSPIPGSGGTRRKGKRATPGQLDVVPSGSDSP